MFNLKQSLCCVIHNSFADTETSVERRMRTGHFSAGCSGLDDDDDDDDDDEKKKKLQVCEQ